MRANIVRNAASWLLLTAAASAQYVIEGASFGQTGQISPNGRAIPGWHITAEGHSPQLLSDRIVLTPPAPGSTRGAIWADNAVPQQYWTSEISFRASGQERGSGNLQIWYVSGGRQTIGSNSVYTVGNFDGLVLTVDQYGGKGGMLRGFLNDGSTSYKDHHSVDSLAFGHCDFNYRNLGEFSRVRVVNDAHGFSVDIDDKPCFSTNEVDLPRGYFLGITAATADNPDSFEISKVVTSTTSAISRDMPVPKHARQSSHQPETSEEQGRLPNAPEMLADIEADQIRIQEAQFADLHNRLQGMTHQIANIFGEFEKLSQQMNQKQTELLAKMPASSEAGLSAMSRRLETIERGIERIQRDVEGRDYKEHLTNLQQAVEGVRGGLSETLPNNLKTIVTGSAPKTGTFVLVVVVVQVGLLGAYIVYKRRRDNAPKKFL